MGSTALKASNLMSTLHEAGKIVAIAAQGVPPEQDLSDALMTITRRAARSQSASALAWRSV